MVDKQDAFEMVDFVLQAGREQAFGFERPQLPVAVKILGADLGWPFDFLPDIRKRKAAFLANRCFVRRPQYLRIDEHSRLVTAIFLREVHDENALRHADLDCSKSDTLGRIHAFQHAVRERSDRGIYAPNRLGNFFQTRIWRDKDGAGSHGPEISDTGGQGKGTPAAAGVTGHVRAHHAIT